MDRKTIEKINGLFFIAYTDKGTPVVVEYEQLPDRVWFRILRIPAFRMRLNSFLGKEVDAREWLMSPYKAESDWALMESAIGSHLAHHRMILEKDLEGCYRSAFKGKEK